MTWSRRLAGAAALLCSLGAQAGFAPLTGQQVLQQFNLVVLGDATTNAHVHGRAYVGGNLSGSSLVDVAMDAPLPPSNYAALTVMGHASGAKVLNNNPTTVAGVYVGGNLSNSSINNGGGVVRGNATNSSFNGTGSVFVGGSNKSGSNFNSGQAASVETTTWGEKAADAAASTQMADVMNGLSDQLATLAGNSSVVRNGNKAVFTAAPDADGVAVFTLNGDFGASILGAGEFDFNLGSATTLIFNSDLSSISISANFLGGSATGLLAHAAVWNFHEASSVTIDRNFGGTVLATGASFNHNQDIDGSVVVASYTQTGAKQIHLHSFTGQLPPPGETHSVPEPSTALLALLSLGLAARLRRRAR